jgi:PhnB protein
MKISVHLSFSGDCGEAFAEYARIFGGTIVFQMKYGESPVADQVPADWQDKLYHATMTVGDLTVMGGDHQIDYQAPKGFMLTVNPSTADEARRVFDALAEAGTVQMAIQETFWSPAFGMLIDPFGVPWSINCGQQPEVA